MPATKDRAHAETVSDHDRTFEGIREVVARIEPPARTGEPADARGARALEQVRFACQPGGELHTGADCRRCSRFVNWLPSPDHNQVTIRCLWRESDRAADLMALVSSIPLATEEMSVGEAANEAAVAGMRFLAVAEDGCFRGIVRAEDLEGDPRTLVRERMIRPSWSVPPDATLADVVAVMKAYGTDVVPVLEAGELVGIVWRGALCDAGLAGALEEP